MDEIRQADDSGPDGETTAPACQTKSEIPLNAAHVRLLENREVSFDKNFSGLASDEFSQLLEQGDLLRVFIMLKDSLGNLVAKHGNGRLRCLRRYSADSREQDLALRDGLDSAVADVAAICHQLKAISEKIELQPIAEDKLDDLLSFSLDVGSFLVSLCWVDTPLIIWLNLFQRLSRKAQKSRTNGTRLSDNLHAFLYLLSKVQDRVNKSNYTQLTPAILNSQIYYKASESSVDVRLAFTVLELVDNFKEPNAALSSAIRYLCIISYLGELRQSPSIKLASVFKKLSRTPSRDELKTCEALTLIFSHYSTPSELVHLHSYLIKPHYAKYQHFFLEWLAVYFDGARDYSHMDFRIESFTSSRVFRKFLPQLMGHLANCFEERNVKDAALRTMFGLILSMSINKNMSACLEVIAAFKADDYHYLVLLLSFFKSLRKSMMSDMEEFEKDLAGEEVERRPMAERLLRASMRMNPLTFDDSMVPALGFTEALAAYDHKGGARALYDTTVPYPQVGNFETIAAAARASYLIFWLLKNDLECADVIKDETTETKALTIPIFAYVSFILYAYRDGGKMSSNEDPSVTPNPVDFREWVLHPEQAFRPTSSKDQPAYPVYSQRICDKMMEMLKYSTRGRH